MVNTIMSIIWFVFLFICLWFAVVTLKVVTSANAQVKIELQVRGISYHQLPAPSQGSIRR